MPALPRVLPLRPSPPQPRPRRARHSRAQACVDVIEYQVQPSTVGKPVEGAWKQHDAYYNAMTSAARPTPAFIPELEEDIPVGTNKYHVFARWVNTAAEEKFKYGSHSKTTVTDLIM